ncbi:hypothetical protein AJ79_07268 [Helicocarpus griseus UAMH5409]|uniref:Uncharacterized protein n=1 Tax=Helicocarpus griseus UAMH5409 TaxID=1447875 RepID=A0A2B7X4Y0_9EURO|nr:hypothetical protein AJ79_07268 [Helicocarpus griseus UAMH5409]
METDLQNEGRRAHGESEDASNNSYYVATDSNSAPKKSSRGFHHNSQSPRRDHSPLMIENSPTVPSPNHHGRHLPQSSEPNPGDKIMFIPPQRALSPEEVSLLLRAGDTPPVTKQSLGELDLNAIMDNIQLRMDVNFDRDLHFRPVGGEAKTKAANEYWQAIAIEISIYAFCAHNNIEFTFDIPYSPLQHQVFKARLPKMLETLKAVLLTLVPERDCQCVEENLDDSFLLKQLEKGVLNLVGLAEWLANLLKTHCAPMRDQMADEMVEHIRRGFQLQNMNDVAEGLKQLFAILESMKLDVANHQIRAFRILLIHDSVNALRKHFFKKQRIQDNLKEAQCARDWYVGCRSPQRYGHHLLPVPDNFESAKALFDGLFSHLFSFNSNRWLPYTFSLDFDRLCNIQDNIETLVMLEVCWRVFNGTVRRLHGDVSLCSSTYTSLQSRILSIVEYGEHAIGENSSLPGNTTIARFQTNIPNIALEIARAAHMLQGRNSGAACPDGNTVIVVLGQLNSLFWLKSPLFWDICRDVQQRLQNVTVDFAEQYWSMTTLDIADSQHLRPQLDCMSLPQIPDLQCIAKRLAHIGVLHWRVWAPELYCGR